MGKNSILIVDDDLILLKNSRRNIVEYLYGQRSEKRKTGNYITKKGCCARFDIVRYRYAGNGWYTTLGKNEIYSELSGYSCNISHWICGVRL